MIQPRRLSSRFLLLTLATVACGGGAAPAAPSSSTATPPPSATGAPAKPEPAAPAPTASAASAAAEPPPSEPAVKRTMAERLFSPTLAFMINYPNSAPKSAAEQSCAKFPDPGAKAACMDKERGKFLADVLVFEKTDKGSTLTLYRRAGSSLAEISKSKIEVTEDTPERLRVKILSDKGWRPLYAGKKALDVNSRDESSITVDDPQLGQLVYDARIGLLGSSP